MFFKKCISVLLILLTLISFFGCTPAVIDITVQGTNTPDGTVIDITTPKTEAIQTLTPVHTVLPTVFIELTPTFIPTDTPDVTPSKTPIITAEPTKKPQETLPMATADTNGGTKYIALTFDDGPSKRATGRILDVLERYNAKATFFVVGKANPPAEDSDSLKEARYALMKRAVSIGCEIGNHTLEHKHLPKLSKSELTEQIEGVNKRVKEATGKDTRLVRPPYGDLSQSVYDNVNYPFILWNIDTLDWKTRDADSVYNEVIGKVKDGDIVLMHDLYTSTADAVERIVPALIKQGFKLVTVSELFEIKGIKLENGKSYRKAN